MFSIGQTTIFQKNLWRLNFVHNTNGKWYGTSESFIFSFENDNDTTNMKISHVNSDCTDEAIYKYYDQGFNFGGGDFFLYTKEVVIFDYNGCYNMSAINSKMCTFFIPEEIEVFKINAL